MQVSLLLSQGVLAIDDEEVGVKLRRCAGLTLQCALVHAPVLTIDPVLLPYRVSLSSVCPTLINLSISYPLMVSFCSYENSDGLVPCTYGESNGVLQDNGGGCYYQVSPNKVGHLRAPECLVMVPGVEMDPPRVFATRFRCVLELPSCHRWRPHVSQAARHLV